MEPAIPILQLSNNMDIKSIFSFNKVSSKPWINGGALESSDVISETELSSDRYRVLKAILRLSAIFLVAFIVISLLFSAYSWISGIGDNINVAINKDSNNERLTETYRKLYGYGSGYPDTGFDDNYAIDSPSISNGEVAGATVNMANVANGSDTIVAGDYLYIPKLNVRAPIITGQTSDPKVLLTLLNGGVIIYPNSAMPGNAGSTVIIGHSSSDSLNSKYGKVFAGLNRLVVGDQVFVHYGNKDYIYTITRKNTGTVNELSALGLSDDLILGTCWPIGTDKERIIIGAKLETK